QGLQPGSDDYAIAIQIAPLDDYIAKVDPDAEHYPPVFRLEGAGLGHFFLQLNGTGDGIDRARELDQHAITHQLDDPAMVLSDQRSQDFAPALLEDRQGPGLVRLHEAAVADYIGGQNGGKATFHRPSLS